MKLLIILFALIIVTSCLYAQNGNTVTTRRITMHITGRDSVDLSFNESYERIEDSCAVITRHAHIDLKTRKFIGKFKDVTALDPSIVLAKGNYTKTGLKTGLFISRYLNGKLRSKGVYKDNKPEGRWIAYYENEKPALVFEAHNDTIRILDTWDTAGKKIIENGKGAYQVNLGAITWKGKLENGRPDGIWHAFKTDDATQSEIVSEYFKLENGKPDGLWRGFNTEDATASGMAREYFKNGKLQKGRSDGGNYADTSRIVLINEDFFPYSHAEKLLISSVTCNGDKGKHIVNAQYARGGLSSYSEFISRAINPVIRSFDVRAFDHVHVLVLEGEVSQTGALQHFKVHNEVDNRITRGLINALQSLPLLQPATADGKPIIQKFSINFTFNVGVFSYNYKFLPVDRSLL